MHFSAKQAWLMFAWASAACIAQEQNEEEALAGIYGDVEMVSIATGTKKPVYRAASVATVITAKDIAAMGARSLDEVLESVPGMHIARSSVSVLQPVYGIRGIATGNNPQTMILIDGARTHYLHNNGVSPSLRIPLSAVQRIEVIRGPGSAIYGADAYAGVINIITKTASEIEGTSLVLRAGSFSTRDVVAQWGTTVDDWNVGLTIERQKSDGDRDRTVNFDLQTRFDGLFGTSASLAPGALETRYDITDSKLNISKNQWSLHWWNWRQRDAGTGQGAAQTLDPDGSIDNTTNLLSVLYEQPALTQNWQLGFRLSYHAMRIDNDFTLFPAGAVLPIGPDGNLAAALPFDLVLFSDGFKGNPSGHEKTYSGESYLIYTGWSQHRLRFAIGGRNDRKNTRETKNFGPGVLDCVPVAGFPPLDCEGGVIDGTMTQVEGTPFVFLPDSKRHSRFIAVQDEWSFARDWELTAGVRYDRYSDFGNTTNPRLALVWLADYELTAKLLFGRAFRAPAFCELACINNPSVIGNPELDPETIQTSELAFNYRPANSLTFDLSLFKYKAEDMISFAPRAGTTALVAQNVRNQDGRGAELEVDWRMSETWRFKANYAYVDTTNADTDEEIADIPQTHVFANLTWAMNDHWIAGLQIDHVSDRQRAAGDTREAIDDFTWVDLSLRRRQLLDWLDVAISIRNVGNENARDPSNGRIEDFPREGRSYWIEFGFH